MGGCSLEFRKLIKFGNSSHVISLPNSWLKKNKLNKGNVIYLNENGNNELILSHEKKEEVVEMKEKVISLDKQSDDDVIREIISAYTNNFKKIKIVGEDLDKKYDLIRQTLPNLVAIEIIEHTSTMLVLQDFLDIESIALKKIIRRLDILIKSMLTDSRNTLQKDRYFSLMERDKDINRLTILATRVANFYLMHPEKIKPPESLKTIFQFFVIADNMERFADESKRIARVLRTVKPSKDLANMIDRIYGILEHTFSEVMESYYLHNLPLSLKTRKTIREEVLPLCNEFSDRIKEKKYAIIIEKLKTMGNHIKVIGRVIYD